MSPIRESERHRYPANWAEIRAAILERAGDRCECDGRCESPHCTASPVVRIGRERVERIDRDGLTRCRAVNREPHPSTGSRVVLTIAHLDHTPENCDPDNLRAMCQACHLSYDRDHHAATRAANRTGGAA